MQFLSIYLAMLLGAICTLIALTAMRRREKHNVGKFGWLVLILLTPPIGLILFVILGGKKVSAEHDSRPLVDMPQPNDSDAIARDTLLANVATIRGIAAASQENRMVFHATPKSMHDALFDLISSAKNSVFIHTFILIDDKVGNRIVDELCEKAKCGVTVRLMVDGIGSFMFPDKLLERVDKAGGRTTRFKPPSRLSRFAYSNFRNHRKMVIADGDRALVGGSNLVEYEMSTTPDEDTWVDYCLRIDGIAARQVEAIFLSDWNFACDEEVPPTDTQNRRVNHDDDDSATLQVIPVGADGPTEILGDLWLTAINQASDRVWIATPYFVPSPMAMRSLVMAVRRGIEVRIVFPDQSDMPPADYARFDYLTELEELGAQILRLPEKMLHAKVLLVDEEVVYLGSANFDMRSFFLNYELVIGVFNQSKIAEITEWFDELAQGCVRGSAPATRSRRVLSVMTRVFGEEL